jgi:FMN-dependent NADH-azoreductase
MKKVLVINASARMQNSHSRKLTEVFVGHWKSSCSNSKIHWRELGNVEVPHINENWIAAAFKPKATRSAEETETLKTSDSYIAELREADLIVLGAPMYNWSIPSTLKAYVDQVLRVHETWEPDPSNSRHPYKGLLENKTLLLLLSRGAGGYEKGGFNAHLNFQSTYLETVFNIMGISNIQVVAVEGASSRAAQINASTAAAHRQIKALIDRELA